jgi:RNA polymerase I-specific transcription initiation factor RRN3
MCLPIVVREFGRICKTFPHWDCATVLTKNKTLVLPTQTQFGGVNKLDSFFPFDPYLLRRSSKYFSDGYQVWAGPDDDDEEYDTEDEGNTTLNNG